MFLANAGISLQESLNCIDCRSCHTSFPFGYWLNGVPAYMNYYTRQKEMKNGKTVRTIKTDGRLLPI